MATLTNLHRFWISRSYEAICEHASAFTDIFLYRLQQLSPEVLVRIGTDRSVQRAELTAMLVSMVGLALDVDAVGPFGPAFTLHPMPISPAHYEAAYLAFFFALDYVFPLRDDAERGAVQSAWRAVFRMAHIPAGFDAPEMLL
jgi:hypothetical protein